MTLRVEMKGGREVSDGNETRELVKKKETHRDCPIATASKFPNAERATKMGRTVLPATSPKTEKVEVKRRRMVSSNLGKAPRD